MPLFSVNELKKTLPLPEQTRLAIQDHRTTISEILLKKTSRWTVLTGPCSLHHRDSALEYAYRLAALQKKISPSLFLVMRAHVEKPRTCLGWKGMLYDPFLLGQEDLVRGIPLARDLLIELASIIPLSSEFLDPIAANYFADLISWGFIGARTSSSQIHRQLASSLSMPIGFKNSTEGSCDGAIYGALASRHSHSFLQINEDGISHVAESRGNPNTHIVLRGGTAGTNYQPENIACILESSKRKGLQTPLVVDCSHGNSLCNAHLQSDVFYAVLEQHLKGNQDIFGVMLESHIEEGVQPIGFADLSPYQSVTDPCIGWNRTEELILEADQALSSYYCSGSCLSIV